MSINIHIFPALQLTRSLVFTLYYSHQY